MLRKKVAELVTTMVLKIREVHYSRPFHRSVTVIERWK